MLRISYLRVENEQQYYYDLAYARAQQREAGEIQAEAERVVKPPSGFKYFCLYSLAIIGDLVDYAQLTGVGLILTWGVTLIISPILFFSGLGVNKRVKLMREFQENIQTNIAHIARLVQTYTRRYVMAIRMSRKIGVLRRPVRKAALKVARVRKIVLRNPATKNTMAIIADLIPILSLLPWRTIGVYLMKKDEMRTFLETQEVLPEYMEVKASEIEAANDLSEVETEESGAVEQPA